MKKTIKQFVYYKDIDDSQLLEIKAIADSYVNTKNYFFSRFSGVNSYKLLFNYKQSIRDVIVKELNDNPDSYNFNLPARYWKNALDEAITNIKSSWSLKKT